LPELLLADVWRGPVAGGYADPFAPFGRIHCSDGKIAAVVGSALTTQAMDDSYVNVINIHSETAMPLVAKLDDLGKPAWIALIILGFVYWWPVGLATLAFLIGSGRMSSWKKGSLSRWSGGMDQMRSAGTWWQPSRSGNQAFDDYRTETLQRLEEEQREFQEFLRRLRAAKDKQEFDQFMDERRGRSSVQEA
jgi:hypothetical protein